MATMKKQQDMEDDLSENQKGELKAQEEFTALKAASEEEMATMKKQQSLAEADLAATTEAHAQAAQELEDTEEQLALDREFLANLKKKCEATDKEFAERMKSRMEEIAAVQDTIKFLNSDEAYEMFDKTVNTAFTQVANSVATIEDSEAQERQQKLRDLAGAALAKVAGHNASPQLVLIMTSVHLDAFTKVIAEIDKMTAELKKQQQDEVEQRDWCISELNKNNLTTEAAYDKQAALMQKIADLESAIEAMTKDIAAKTKEISDMQTEMKRASENREAENADFQQTVTEQRVTQSSLQAACDRMAQTFSLLQKKAQHHHHHRRQPGTKLAQMSVSETILAAFGGEQQQEQEPGAPQMQLSGTDTEPGSAPARFKEQEQNAGGKKVIKMIEDCIKDAAKSEAEAIASEQDAMAAYQNFMKDSNESIIKYTEAINNMSQEMAKAKEELVNVKEDLDGVNVEIQDLTETDADLHKSCDFLLKNFDVRQAARADEVDALNEAKAILSGAK